MDDQEYENTRLKKVIEKFKDDLLSMKTQSTEDKRKAMQLE